MPSLRERITALSDEARGLIEQASEVRERNEAADEWSAEDRDQFKGIMQAFAEKHSKSEELKGLLADEEKLDDAARFYEQAADTAVKQKELAVRKTAGRADALKRWIQHGSGGLTREEFSTYMVKGRDNVANRDEFEKLALTGQVDNLGGFLVPEDVQAGIIADIAGFAAIRPIARTVQTTTDNGNFMTVASAGATPLAEGYPSGVSGAWRQQAYLTGGTAPTVQDQPTFGNERVPVHSWIPDAIEIPLELMEDSAINLEAEINRLISETRALDEDSAFINGSGVGQPEGILNSGADATITSGGSNVQTYAGIVNLWTGLPAQYRQRPGVRWLMNSLTYGLMLQLEDGASNLLINPYEDVSSMFGKQIVFSEFMPDGDTDGNVAVVLGDFQFYGIVDRMDLRFIL
jgi:HK97 family phage major capsid protein